MIFRVYLFTSYTLLFVGISHFNLVQEFSISRQLSRRRDYAGTWPWYWYYTILVCIECQKIENSYAVGTPWWACFPDKVVLFFFFSDIFNFKFISKWPGVSQYLSFCLCQSLHLVQIGVFFTAEEPFKPQNGSCGRFCWSWSISATALSKIGYVSQGDQIGSLVQSRRRAMSKLTRASPLVLRLCILSALPSAVFHVLFEMNSNKNSISQM